MYQGTTPTIVLTVEGADLDESTCYVTFKCGLGKTITKSGNELAVSGNEIAVHLTQEDTLQFSPGQCEIQVRWIDANGNAMATETANLDVDRVLLKKIIEYQGEG